MTKTNDIVNFYASMSRKGFSTAEADILRRVADITANHPDYVAYHQTDPRGCALYLVCKARLGDKPIDAWYSSLGFGVCY